MPKLSMKRFTPVAIGSNLIVLLLFIGLASGNVLQPAPSVQQKPSGAFVNPVDLSSLAQNGSLEAEYAYSQPIFHSDRHAAEKAPEKPVAQVVVQKPNIEMTGVLQLSQTKGWAFFRDKASGETVQVGIGEDFQGWTLKSLTSTQAVISNGVQEASLVLLGAEPLSMSAIAAGNENTDTGQKPRTRRKK